MKQLSFNHNFAALLAVSPAMAICALLFSAPCDLQAQENTPTPTLQVNVREVVLDVVVTDKKGNAVTGLSRQDFNVFEDAVPQAVDAFQPPSMHTRPADAPPVHSAADLSTIGNAPVTLLVMDEMNTAFEDLAYSRWAMQKWLQRQPERLEQPTVLLAVSDKKFYVVHDYTQDRDELMQTVHKHMPAYPFLMAKGGSAGTDATRRMAFSLGALTQIAQASSGVTGRKNVIWVGAGFPEISLDTVTPKDEQEITAAVAQTTAALLKARVTLNIIDPTATTVATTDLTQADYLDLNQLRTTLGATTGPPAGILSFDTFAPATGGAFTVGLNDIDRQLAQASENGSSYYTLAYKPTNHNDAQAKFRRIRVVMRDPNLMATTRTGYFPEPLVASGPPKPPPTSQLAFDLTNAALSNLSYNGLAVTAALTQDGYSLQVARNGLTFRNQSGNSELAEVTVMTVCLDAKKNILSHTVAELHSTLKDDNSASSVLFQLPMRTPPKGTVRVRLVVRDAANGHIGTVDMSR